MTDSTQAVPSLEIKLASHKKILCVLKETHLELLRLKEPIRIRHLRLPKHLSLFPVPRSPKLARKFVYGLIRMLFNVCVDLLVDRSQLLCSRLAVWSQADQQTVDLNDLIKHDCLGVSRETIIA